MPLPIGTTVYNKRPFTGDFDALIRFLPREFNIIDRAIKDVHVRPYRTVTDTVTLTLDDALVLADATGGAFTVTLPDVAEMAGRSLIIKKIDAVATVTVASAADIDGAASTGLTTQYQSVTVASDGSTWWIVA